MLRCISQVPPTKRAISGWLAIRCWRVMVELLVRPTSATRPIVCGKLDVPIALPVLKEYSADVALGAPVSKSPTLQRSHLSLSEAKLLGWHCSQDWVALIGCSWVSAGGTQQEAPTCSSRWCLA